jgi:3-phosphoglycerate kinase
MENQGRNTPAHAAGRGIAEGWQAVDIGRETIAQYKAKIGKAKTKGIARSRPYGSLIGIDKVNICL